MVELAARYWRFVQHHYLKDGKPTSEENAHRGGAKPLKALYGHTPAAEFGPLALSTARIAWMSEQAVPRHWSTQRVGTFGACSNGRPASSLSRSAVLQALQAVDGFARQDGGPRNGPDPAGG